jgi:hypothetical protein
MASHLGVGHLRLTSERHAKSGERGMPALNSLVRNIQIRRERLVSRYQQKCQQNGQLERTFAFVFNASRKVSREIRNRANGLSYCYY